MKTLHILNGDSSLHQFNKTSLEGDTLVWREILCEGKTREEIGSAPYWETRKEFLKNYAKDSFEKHFENLKQEISSVRFSDYEEVILWFEYDLFCQINMLGAIAWLHHFKKEQTCGITC